ncbi:MAG: hypothetical protein ACOX6V_00345 [Patescibacteria group bacterium]|jgi:hypothetical protein
MKILFWKVKKKKIGRILAVAFAVLMIISLFLPMVMQTLGAF